MSELSVGWVDLADGRSGIGGLSETVSVPDQINYGTTYTDRTATLPAGAGNVVPVLWGRIPAWTGLIPAAPEYFGMPTPSGAVVHV